MNKKKIPHILLVEDNRDHVELIRRAFESYSRPMSLNVAGSIHEARICIKKSPPALVITDICLPDGEGTKLLTVNKKEKCFPVVVMTAFGNEQLAVKTVKSGALDYVVKSESAMADMPHVVERALREWQYIMEQKKAEEALRKMHVNLRLEKQKLEQILNIDQKMSSILDLNHLVDFIINNAIQILEAEKCSLMLLDADSQELLIRGAQGLNGEIVEGARIKLGEQIAGLVAKEGKPLLVDNIETDPYIARKNRSQYQTKSFMSVPIKVHNKLVGVVNVADKKSNESKVFTKTDLKILYTIVHQAAIAIENANYYRELEYLSTSDSLTGLFNHRYFVRSLSKEISRVKRYPKPLCLLMMDIDDFKSYNDTYGHFEGDCLLKKISKILKEGSRVIDIVCRYAGDEFVCILPETDLSQAQVVAKKIITATANLNLKRTTTVSIGLAKYRRDNDHRDLTIKADRALYQAKKEGKNKICFL